MFIPSCAYPTIMNLEFMMDKIKFMPSRSMWTVCKTKLCQVSHCIASVIYYVFLILRHMHYFTTNFKINLTTEKNVFLHQK